MKLNCPLVTGETPSNLVTTMTLADLANGIGARLDPLQFNFLNTDLTVNLHSPPVGPWVGLQAESSVGPDGVGMSSAVIHSATGPVGRLTQTLLVERHPIAGQT